MHSITDSIEAFLEAESRRVSQRTVDVYIRTLELMASHLDTYGDSLLNAEELKHLGRAGADRDEDDWEGLFCGAFDVEKALEAYYYFYFWFLIRKVMAPVSLLTDSARTGKRFARWLVGQGWVSPETAQRAFATAVDAGRLLPRSDQLNSSLYEVMDRLNLSYPKIHETHEGLPAIITRVEPRRIWFDGYPVDVFAEASDVAEVGWQVTTTLGRTDDGWTIVELGFVYPMPLP